nr:endonuclease/exonuclease/phosphatase [Tanacetum cinerariifolium]
MPVIIHDIHTCVRIHEILGESNEILKNESYVGSSPSAFEEDEDYVKGNNGNNHVDEDDDLFDDGSKRNDFLHQGGSWIKDTCEDNVNGDFLKSSELFVEGLLKAMDNDANLTKNPDTSDFSKRMPTCDSQTTLTYQVNADFGSSPHHVPETQFKLKSPIRQSTFVLIDVRSKSL